MTDLPISGTLSVGLDEASVRSVEQRLEEIEDQQLSIGSVGGQGRSGGVQGREQAMVRQHLTNLTDVSEEQAEWLELIYFEIADEGSADLLDAGEGSGFFASLFDTGTDAAPGAALVGAAAALTGSAKALGAAAAALGGTSVLDFLTGNDLPFGDDDDVYFGDLEDRDFGLDVEEPEWLPIEIEEIDVLSVEEPTLGVDDPSPLGVDPDYHATLDPDYIAPVDDTPIPVDVSIGVDVSAGGQSASSDGGDPGRLQLLREEEWPVVGPTFERINEAGEDFVNDSPLGVLPSRRDAPQPSQEAESTSTTVTVDVDARTEVSTDLDRVTRDLRRDLEAQIREIERELDQLDRSIRRA